MKLNYKLLILGTLAANFTSCVDLQEMVSEAKENASEEIEQGAAEFAQEQNYDWDYASNMNDNFSEYEMQEEHDCFRMKQGSQQRQLPMMRPRQHVQTFGQNQYGMAVDGTQIRYNQESNQRWAFQTNPANLISNQGNGRIIGIHKNGAPIYGYYDSPYSDTPNTDQYGGRYAPTEDFPDGIYHYVITINID